MCFYLCNISNFCNFKNTLLQNMLKTGTFANLTNFKNICIKQQKTRLNMLLQHNKYIVYDKNP